jgi:hypothetical protein
VAVQAKLPVGKKVVKAAITDVRFLSLPFLLSPPCLFSFSSHPFLSSLPLLIDVLYLFRSSSSATSSPSTPPFPPTLATTTTRRPPRPSTFPASAPSRSLRLSLRSPERPLFDPSLYLHKAVMDKVTSSKVHQDLEIETISTSVVFVPGAYERL